MEGFEALKFVTGGATLIGLVVLCVVALLRSAVNRDVELLRSVDGGDAATAANRERVALNALEKFHVDTTGMSSADRKELALAQLVERRRRTTPILIFCFALAVLGLIGTIFAVFRPTASVASKTGSDSQSVVGTTGAAPPDAAQTSGASSDAAANNSDCSGGVASCNHVAAGSNANVQINGTLNVDVDPHRESTKTSAKAAKP